MIYIYSSQNAPQWFGELSNGLLLIQKIMAGFLALHTGHFNKIHCLMNSY